MKKCKELQSLIIEYNNGLLDSKEKKEIEVHLSNCRFCRREFENYTSLIGLIKERKRQNPSRAFNAVTWAEIKKRKESEIQERIPFFEKIGIAGLFRSVPAVPALTAAAFLAIGLFLGWIVFSPSPEGLYHNEMKSRVTDEFQEIAYNDRAEKLIDKSKILIIGLANFDPSKEDVSVLNLKQSKRLSEGYLKEALFLNKNLNSSRQARMKRLVADLEFILMQIASLEKEDNLESVEIIRNGIDGRGILLKINLEEIDRIERSSGKVNKSNINVI
jgi:hypothetical protein